MSLVQTRINAVINAMKDLVPELKIRPPRTPGMGRHVAMNKMRATKLHNSAIYQAANELGLTPEGSKVHMDNNDFNIGTTSAPRELLVSLVEEYGTDNMAFLKEEFIARVLKDAGMLDAAINYWFANNWPTLKKAEETANT